MNKTPTLLLTVVCIWSIEQALVEAVERLLDHIPESSQKWIDEADPAASSAPWKIYNVCNDRSVEISRVVEVLEAEPG